MNKFFQLTASCLVVVMLFSACASQKVTSSSVSPDYQKGEKKYKKIFITALIAKEPDRTSLETHLSDALRSMGYETVRSVDVMPGDLPSFINGQPDPNAILEKVRSNGCDLLFTVALLQKETKNTKTAAYSGPVIYNVDTMLKTMWWMLADKGRGAPPSIIWIPSFNIPDNKYTMAGNLVELASEKSIWSVQSLMENPTGLEQFSRDMTNGMIGRMKSDLGLGN
jgi:hypothetical protein